MGDEGLPVRLGDDGDRAGCLGDDPVGAVPAEQPGDPRVRPGAEHHEVVARRGPDHRLVDRAPVDLDGGDDVGQVRGVRRGDLAQEVPVSLDVAGVGGAAAGQDPPGLQQAPQHRHRTVREPRLQVGEVERRPAGLLVGHGDQDAAPVLGGPRRGDDDDRAAAPVDEGPPDGPQHERAEGARLARAHDEEVGVRRRLDQGVDRRGRHEQLLHGSVEAGTAQRVDRGPGHLAAVGAQRGSGPAGGLPGFGGGGRGVPPGGVQDGEAQVPGPRLGHGPGERPVTGRGAVDADHDAARGNRGCGHHGVSSRLAPVSGT